MGIFLCGIVVGVIAGIEFGERGWLGDSGYLTMARGPVAGPGETVNPDGGFAETGHESAGHSHAEVAGAEEAFEETADEQSNGAEAHFQRLYEEPLERAPNYPEPGATAITSALPEMASTEAVPEAGAEEQAPSWTTVADLRQQASLPRLLAPSQAPDELPRWKANAVAAAPARGRPMIAIVLDDLGLNRPGTRRAIALPAPLTLAFMTYADGLKEMTRSARAAGHELMVHVPMEPRDGSYDPGPNVLTVDLHPAELIRRLDWGLGRFDGYVGINNHMGSRFSTDREGMTQVMKTLQARGLLFLDSRTASGPLARNLAEQAAVPYVGRDVFLDNKPQDLAAIQSQLDSLERIARQRGYAIGIGHPHKNTLAALAEWLPKAEARGLALVPVSAIVAAQQASQVQRVAKKGTTG